MGPLLRLAAGAVVVVAIVGGGLYVAAQQRTSTADGLATVPTSADAARSFDDQLAALGRTAEEARRSGKVQPVELLFTEQELTSKAAAVATSAGPGVSARDTQVHLPGPYIVATTTVTVSGMTLSVGVVAEPVAVDGRTRIVVREIQTGLIPLPASLAQQLAAEIERAIDVPSLGLPMTVTDVRVVDGTLVVRGTTSP